MAVGEIDSNDENCGRNHNKLRNHFFDKKILPQIKLFSPQKADQIINGGIIGCENSPSREWQSEMQCRNFRIESAF